MKITKEQLAQDYGVPMSETCKTLDWPHNSNFWWAFNESGKYYLCLINYAEEFVSLQTGMLIDADDAFKAPQFHEIWAALPKTIEVDATTFTLAINESYMFYQSYYDSPKKFTKIQDSNFTEAAAQLYLTLKKEGYID